MSNWSSPLSSCAGTQAMDLFTNMKSGEGTFAAYRSIRKAASHHEQDWILAYDIETMVNLIRSDKIVDVAEKAVGELH